jgi:hypothetical protein
LGDRWGMFLLFKLLFNDIKNGTNCLELAPFGCVTATGQIPMHFMEDLKRLAYDILCLSFIVFVILVWMPCWGLEQKKYKNSIGLWQ